MGERAISFKVKKALYCTLQTSHLHLSPPECSCIRMWDVASLLPLSFSSPVQFEKSIRHYYASRPCTHILRLSETHQNQITQQFISQYSHSPVRDSWPITLRASHTSSLELATSASKCSLLLPPNMVKKVYLMGPACLQEIE